MDRHDLPRPLKLEDGSEITHLFSNPAPPSDGIKVSLHTATDGYVKFDPSLVGDWGTITGALLYDDAMTIDDDYEEFIDRFFEGCAAMLIEKRRKYASDDDPLANFKETAAFLGVDMRAALLPHLHKHYRNIVNAIQRGEKLPTDSLIDAANYLAILAYMEED